MDLTVPEVGESITEVLLVEWLKAAGDSVALDEPIAVIETDKATMEIPSPVAGVLRELLVAADEYANVGDVIAKIEEGAVAEAVPTKAAAPTELSKESSAQEAAPQPPAADGPKSSGSKPFVMPAAARLLAERGIGPEGIQGTGPSGRILKEDVIRHLEVPKDAPKAKAAAKASAPPGAASAATGERHEEAVRLTPMRRAVARRLVEAQQTAALLTTFNEIDMSEVKALRKAEGPAFQEKHGVRLGFLSFFIKASIEALKQFPAVNAEIRGDEIIYRNYFDVGVAIGGGKGLVVPMIRNAERMSFAEIELAVQEYGERAKENKITLEELQGGTFTISNGGVYGSLLSTPIVNPPQSGILGLHAIQDRPVAIDGEVVIRPMMYVALTYDHRLVDGREAVTFLRTIKHNIEQPARMLLEI